MHDSGTLPDEAAGAVLPHQLAEEDQVSNNKLTSFGISLLKLCGKYLAGPKAFVEREWRDNIIEDYSYEVVASNL